MRIVRRGQTLVAICALAPAGCTDSPTAPTDEFDLTLVGEIEETREREIRLAVAAPTALEVRLAEGRVDTATFRAADDTLTWVLSPGDGEKLVEGQVRFPSGDLSPVVTLTLYLAEDVYASPSGADTAPGSYLQPKRSVGAAIATAASEGRSAVRLREGRYAPSTTGEVFPLSVPGGLTLRNADEGRPILDAEGTGTVVLLEGVVGVTLRGLTLTGGSAALGGGLRANAASALLEDLRIWENVAQVGSGILIEDGSDLVLRRSVVSHNLSSPGADAHGIEARLGSRVTLHNNTIGLHDSNGILIRDTSGGDIRNNIIFQNGQTSPATRGRGICEVSSTHTTVLSHNLFHENVVAAVLLGGTGDLSASEANDHSATDLITDNFEADPLFMDAANRDFRLAAGSPVVDAGDPNPVFRDADGTRNDIGHLGGR